VVGAETGRHLWVCKACGHQTAVTAGTVMHGTRTPLRTWFWAAYLVATHHPGISARQLQHQLGLSRYETAWLVLQKLRRAMVAPEREPLKREVEVDQLFLGGVEEGTHGARLHTDGWRGYLPLRKAGHLPRAHRAISNLKAWMHGTHRGVSKEHLPVYLDEYVFRHNRRSTPMAAIQTLLGLGSTKDPTTYAQITRRAA